MNAFYQAILALLQAISLPVVGGVPTYGAANFFVDIWNEQFDKLMAKDEEGNRLYAIQLPAVFIEIEGETDQLGGGLQIYPDLKVIFHLVHEQLDAGDGTMDRNVDVIALQDILYKVIQMYSGPGANQLIRKKPTQNFRHEQCYHFVIEYGTTLVDSLADQPVDQNNATQVTAQTVPQPITPEITETITPENNL